MATWLEGLWRAWAAPTPSTGAKVVLLALAMHADAEGVCWPSQRRLAGMCGISDRAVRHHLVELQRLGLVACIPRLGRTTMFKLRAQVVRTVHALPTHPGSTLPEGAEAQFRGTPEAGFQDSGSTLPPNVQELPEEQPGNTHRDGIDEREREERAAKQRGCDHLMQRWAGEDLAVCIRCGHQQRKTA